MSQNTSAQNVARAMRDTFLPVAYFVDEQGKLCGSATGRDFSTKLVSEFKTTDIPIHEIMTRNPVSVSSDATVAQVVDVFERTGLKRLPVVDQSNFKITGFVTIEDLIAGGAIEGGRLIRMTRNQMKQWLSFNKKERTDPHSEQTLASFYKRIGNQADLPSDFVPEMSYFLIGALVRRVSFSVALHLIAQLPVRLQDELLKLPAGPDREINPRAIIEEMIFRFEFTESFSRKVLRQFYSALEEVVGSNVVNHLKAQLPEDFRNLFAEAGAETQERIPEVEAKSTMEIKSQSFKPGDMIPVQYSGEGNEKSPGLVWSNLPEGTKECALICEDPDAPSTTPWIHWVVYNISPTISGLPEGLPAKEEIDLPVRIKQGRNSSGLVGYQGPMPPKGHGTHRYIFKLYALNKQINLHGGATKEELIAEMSGHVIASAEIIGRYRREAGKGAEKKLSA